MEKDSHLRKKDWIVKPVESHSDVVSFITEHHYANGAGKTAVFRFGLYRRDDLDVLMGAAVWLPPTYPAAKYAARVVADDESRHKEVISLSRLAIHPDVPTNGASFLLSRMRRKIVLDGRYTIGVTYADTAQGHTGSIYAADNWTYDGNSRSTPIWIDPESGRMVSPKIGRVNRSKQDMVALGYVLTGHSVKRRFLRFL